jgi:hypothetical protein
MTTSKTCECVNRAPTFPVFRDFEHFPECPLAELGYWKRREMAEFLHGDAWESRYLKLNDQINPLRVVAV